MIAPQAASAEEEAQTEGAAAAAGGARQSRRLRSRAANAPALAATYAPHHRWIYLSDMTTQEAVIFKQYDWRPGNRARASFHNSFHDTFHDDWKDCPGRRSVECRLLLVFDEEAKPKL